MNESGDSETTSRPWRLVLVILEAIGWVVVAACLPLLVWSTAGVLVQPEWVTWVVVAATVIGAGLVVAARWARRARGMS